MAALVDLGAINKLLDDVYRQVCCRWCWGRPTYPTDFWFQTKEVNDYKIQMVRNDKVLDIPYLEKSIQQNAGRVKPKLFWLAGTRDLLCCCIPTNDEAKFGFFIVRQVTVQASGQSSIQVWPEHIETLHTAMSHLTDQFHRPISVERIQRAKPLPECVQPQEHDDQAASSLVLNQPLAQATQVSSSEPTLAHVSS